jgi:hypothetical protein
MGWTGEYVQEEQMALMAAAGVIRDEDTKRQIGETIGLLKHHGATSVLIDCTEAVSEVSLASIYRLPDYVTQLGAPWLLRVALVIPRRRYRMETYELTQLVFNNAGYDVKLFETKAAAEDWLQHPPAAPRFVNQFSAA